MLFVSRRIGRDKYGVVDTDDGVEEIVIVEDITRCIREYGLHIEGLIQPDEDNIFATIQVYQPPEEMTQLQIKTEMLLGVSVKVFKGVISSISWRPERIPKPVTLRLSDFGSGCYDGVILRAAPDAYRHVITLVLDDKFQFDLESFRVPFGQQLGIKGLGVVFDVRELTDQLRLKAIYKTVFRYSDDPDLDLSLIDHPDRIKEMVGRYYELAL